MSFLSSCPLSLVVKAPWHWWRNPILLLLLLLLLPLKRFGGSSFWFFLQCQKSSCLACQRPPIHHQGMSNYSVLVPCYWIEYIYCASLFLSSMALEVMMIVAKSSSIFSIPLIVVCQENVKNKVRARFGLLRSEHNGSVKTLHETTEMTEMVVHWGNVILTKCEVLYWCDWSLLPVVN